MQRRTLADPGWSTIHNPLSIFFVLGHPPVICGNPGKMKSAKNSGRIEATFGKQFSEDLGRLDDRLTWQAADGNLQRFRVPVSAAFSGHLRIYIALKTSSAMMNPLEIATPRPSIQKVLIWLIDVWRWLRKESLSCEHHELMMWHRGNGSFHFGWDEVTTSQLSNPRLPKVLAHPFYINGVRWVKYGSSIFSSSSSWYDVQSPID